MRVATARTPCRGARISTIRIYVPNVIHCRPYSIMSRYQHLQLQPIPNLPAAIPSIDVAPAPKTSKSRVPPPPPPPRPGQAQMTDRDKAVAEVAYVAKPSAPTPVKQEPRPFIIAPLPRESAEAKEPDQPEDPRSLTVAIVGAPNAGKSTLLNKITDAKISAVSPKAQTTRRNILGINTHENVQLVRALRRVDNLTAQAFYDTPGIVPVWQQKQVVRDIVTSAWHAAFEADMLLYLVDAAKRVDESVLHTVAQIRKLSREGKHQLLLVLNKADLVTRDLIVQRVSELQADSLFHDVFVISASRGVNTDSLLSFLRQRALPREWDYHSSVITTQTDRERAMEIIREQIFLRFNREVPYSVKLVLRSWVHLPNGDLAIEVVLHIEKSSQKAMLIGRAGEALKMITTNAGANLSASFKRPVKLFMSVKVDKSASNLPDVVFQTPNESLLPKQTTTVLPKKSA